MKCLHAILALTAFFLFTRWINARQRRKYCWTLVADGRGNHSFLDGDGHLYPLDFATREEAEQRLQAEMRSLPFDFAQAWVARSKRERAYRASLGP